MLHTLFDSLQTHPKKEELNKKSDLDKLNYLKKDTEVENMSVRYWCSILDINYGTHLSLSSLNCQIETEEATYSECLGFGVYHYRTISVA